MLKHIDFWIKSAFGDFAFLALLASAFIVAILSIFW